MHGLRRLVARLGFCAGAWLACAVAPAGAEDVAIDVPFGDKLKVVVPDGWKHSIVQPVPSLPPTLDIEEPKAPLMLKITFLPDRDGKLAKEAELNKLMKATTGLYLAGSVEQKLELQPIKTKNGRGVYATFTDASLVDKKELPPGQFRIVTSGILVVGKQAAAFTLLANRLDGKEYEAAMQILTEGISVP
jgi:hypothetical protein